MCVDIKKLQINVIAHMFLRKSICHSDETFNNLDSRANINVFLKPSMISHPPYHSNRINNSNQPNKIN